MTGPRFIQDDSSEPFVSAERPPDAESETSDDLSCEVCGTPLAYAGRGRKPRYCDEHKRKTSDNTSRTTMGSRGAGRGSASVEQAIATLGGIYEIMSVAYLLVSPNAAVMWQQNIDELQTRNRAILAADPDLTRSINRLGARGGKAAFISAQAMAVIPPTMLAIGDVRARAAERDRTSGAEKNARFRGARRGNASESAGPSTHGSDTRGSASSGRVNGSATYPNAEFFG